MDREASAIRLSAYAAAFFGVLGTSIGVWLDSEAILVDGIFNWISFALVSAASPLVIVDARVDPARTLRDLEVVRRRVHDRTRRTFPTLQLALLFHPH